MKEVYYQHWISSPFIAGHISIHLQCPGINATGQAADIFQAMAGEVSGGIQGLLAEVVDEDQGGRWIPIGHDFLHHRLRHED